MKVAVVGAYGNGKTTVVSRLAGLTRLPMAHGTPMRNPAGGAPKSLEDTEPAELIQLVVRRYAERVQAETAATRGFISDGSLLHEWVYATVRLAVGMHPPAGAVLEPGGDDPYAKVVAALGPEIARRAAQAYDLVVHLPVEFPLHDEVKPISERFRVLSDELLLATFAAESVPVHTITGTVDARLAAFAELCRTSVRGGT